MQFRESQGEGSTRERKDYAAAIVFALLSLLALLPALFAS